MLGIGKGRLIIKLEKFNYSVGETISGIVFLDLKKPVQAKELVIALRGDRKSRGGIQLGDSHNNRRQEEHRVYEFEIHLDGEKEYTKGMEYPFEIVVPEDVRNLQPNMPGSGGVLGSVMKVAQTAATMTGVYTQLKWYLHAKLDVPRGIDVKDDQDITIQ